jgi:hypothetical protein
MVESGELRVLAGPWSLESGGQFCVGAFGRTLAFCSHEDDLY